MTEVKLRHLLFFILIFILTWFWNWIALVFFALVIVSMIGTVYHEYTSIQYEKCYYYAEFTDICHFYSYETVCTGKCSKFVIVKK